MKQLNSEERWVKKYELWAEDEIFSLFFLSHYWNQTKRPRVRKFWGRRQLGWGRPVCKGPDIRRHPGNGMEEKMEAAGCGTAHKHTEISPLALNRPLTSSPGERRRESDRNTDVSTSSPPDNLHWQNKSPNKAQRQEAVDMWQILWQGLSLFSFLQNALSIYLPYKYFVHLMLPRHLVCIKHLIAHC